MVATSNTTLWPFDENASLEIIHTHIYIYCFAFTSYTSTWKCPPPCNSGSNRRELSPSCDFLPTKSISGIGKMIDFDGGLNFKDNIVHAHSIPILGVGKERRKKNGPWLYLKRHHLLLGLN